MTTSQRKTVMSVHSSQVSTVPQVLFTQDGCDEGIHPESFWLQEELWDDMGQPDTITITVEVGDLLNVEEEEETPLIRDAGSGQFVTEEFAKENPETTVTES